jgi:hypothetical protein
VTETVLDRDGLKYILIDPAEPLTNPKIYSQFSHVDCVFYFCALDEYDKFPGDTPTPENNTCLMVESLRLWRKVTSSPGFDRMHFVLILNKADLLRTCLEANPLSNTFSDYSNWAQTPSIQNLDFYEQGWRFIAKQFEIHFGGMLFYCHITVATDKKNCEKVWDSIRSEAVRRSLASLHI